MSDLIFAEAISAYDMKTFIVPLATGAVAGLIAALCGVGGGIVLVPCFVLILGLNQQSAVATSLAVIAPAVLVATFKNAGNQLIDWKVFIPTVLGAMIVAWFAADWLKSLSNATLQKIFAITLLIFGTVMLFRK